MEVGGFVVSRVYMKKHKTRAAFNVHVRWKKEGEKEKFVLVGYLTADKKADLAAVRALLEAAADKENNKRQRQQQEGEKDDDDEKN